MRAVRRVLAPAALELEGETARRIREIEDLKARVQQLEERLRTAEERLEHQERLAGEVAELRAGLHEARRLSLRIAELTDLVTELVLPLHDRDIDPSALASLRPDTL
jgi:uncharacterized coiled-coil DUF342 family protein